MFEKDFKETIVNIKNEIINTQTQILSDVNRRLINLYFKLGKIINDNSKWGDKFIETLEVELKLDFPNVKGFSTRNLRRMKMNTKMNKFCHRQWQNCLGHII